MAEKPLPRITAVNRPFWEACNEGRLMLQRCTSPDCGKAIFYPRVCCPHCGGGDVRWYQSAGTGEVATFTVVQRPHHESFYDEAPFIFAAIALDDGVLMYSRLLSDPADTATLIGRRVRAVFRPLRATQQAPYFELLPVQ